MRRHQAHEGTADPDRSRRAKDFEWFEETFNTTLASIEKTLRCHPELLRHALSALVAGGHILIEDVPGTGKSTFATSIAAVTRGTVKSVHLTPDLLPSDLTGWNQFLPKEQEYEFQRGAIFANVFIAENLNRASPKTQAALLGAMDFGQVNHESGTYPLPRPFSLIATQNPREEEGAYPITSAVYDRFAMRLEIGEKWLSSDVLIDLVREPDWSHLLQQFGPARPVRSLDLLRMSRVASTVYVAPQIAEYLLALAEWISRSSNIKRGVSLRAKLSIARLMQVSAAASGRDYVLPEDLQQMATAALAHRVELKAQAILNRLSTSHVVDEALQVVQIPNLR